MIARLSVHRKNASQFPNVLRSTKALMGNSKRDTQRRTASRVTNAPPDFPTWRRLRFKTATPQPRRPRTESRELPVDEVLRSARPHPPHGEHAIADLTDAEADAFLEAVLS